MILLKGTLLKNKVYILYSVLMAEIQNHSTYSLKKNEGEQTQNRNNYRGLHSAHYRRERQMFIYIQPIWEQRELSLPALCPIENRENYIGLHSTHLRIDSEKMSTTLSWLFVHSSWRLNVGIVNNYNYSEVTRRMRRIWDECTFEWIVLSQTCYRGASHEKSAHLVRNYRDR